MLEQVMPIILALFGLSILIFVHELGHLIAALQAKMEVEAFGIGFGRPVVSFFIRGIRFNLCWIPFGGYVKIAGMDNASLPVDPSKRTFFTSTPWQRIKVALAGPFANILFSLFVFSMIWGTGGRDKPFSEITSRVGWVDPKSELYSKGLRPGDRILGYSGRPVHSSLDHIQAAMTSGQTLAVDFETMAKYALPPKRISCVITPYQHPRAPADGLLTTGVLAPASFVIWNPYSGRHNDENLSLPSILRSGIRPYDRIVWVDNTAIFSLEQLQEVINDGTVLVSVIRNGNETAPVHLRIPRVKAADLKLSSEVKGEISDWQYMANLQGKKATDLWVLPYNLTADNIVEHPLVAIDASVQMPKNGDSLLPGDHIIAVQGESVSHAYQTLKNIQEKVSLVIVDRQSNGNEIPFSKDFPDIEAADSAFCRPFGSHDLYELVKSIGRRDIPVVTHEGSFRLLQPIVLRDQSFLIEHIRMVQSGAYQKHLSASDTSDNVKDRYEADASSSSSRKAAPNSNGSRRYVLGLVGVGDAAVRYNPGPITMLFDSVKDVFHTLSALVTGNLSPKWMAGPIGIVDSIQHKWTFGGVREAFFWLSILSVNLALLNLLPLPALDGGYVVLSLFEMVTGLKPSIALLEKIVFPFILLLIGLFLYLTYNDITRLILRLFSGGPG